MSGKIVVVVFLVASVVFTAYLTWYLFSRSPIDQRFNLARDKVPSTLVDSALLPRTLDDYQRGDVASLPAETSEAKYTDSQYTIDFAVTSLKGQDIGTVISNVLNKSNCQDTSGTLISHTDNTGQMPYAYNACPAQNIYKFQWINGIWLFSASASDPEALLGFVNLYGY